MTALYSPAISVWIIKARPRTIIAGQVRVNSARYSDVTELDITPYLGQGSIVETNKSVREPAGTFTITIPDQAFSKSGKSPGDTLYAFIEPMDLVEIRMSHTGAKNANGEYPLIMRGFVSARDRRETIGSGTPQRVIRISGHDYGKILQMIQIQYLPQAIIGQYWTDTLRFFQLYANSSANKSLTVSDFIVSVLNNSVNKYISDIVVLKQSRNGQRLLIDRLTPDVTVPHVVSAKMVNAYENVSMYDMFRDMFDVPIFNEMYTQDTETSVNWVIRPTPFKEVTSGQFIQGTADEKIIIDQNIFSRTSSINDNGVANIFLVTTSFMNADVNQLNILQSRTQALNDYTSLTYPNTDRSLFTLRMMQVDSKLLPEGYAQNDEFTQQKVNDAKDKIYQWVNERQQLLRAMNVDNLILESGTLQMTGQETVQAGTYIKIGNSNQYMGEVYAHTVSHRFEVYGKFTTDVIYDRGTMLYERSIADQSHYYADMNGKGVVG